MTRADIESYANNRIAEVIRWAYEAGKEDCKKELETDMRDKTTTLINPTDAEKDSYKYFGLEAWCAKCGKGIQGAWGLVSFCPHCGRRVIRR